MVGGRGEAAGVGENKVGSHEEIGDVCCGDVASDGLVAAGGEGCLLGQSCCRLGQSKLI